MADTVDRTAAAALSAGATPIEHISTGAVPTTAQTAAIVGDEAAPRRRIGTSELSVFPLAISGKMFGWKTNDATTDDILDHYAAHGGNVIDTADSYSSGRSELMIGNWMRSRRNRDAMLVATKVGRSADNPGRTPLPSPRRSSHRSAACASNASICCFCTSMIQRCRSKRLCSRSTN